MIWLQESWLRESEPLRWPFLDWLHAQHLAALEPHAAVQAAHAKLVARFEAEDRDVRNAAATALAHERKAIAHALEEGREPPPVGPRTEQPATGEIRRELELQAADAAITAAANDVHRLAARILSTLPRYVYELDEAARLMEERVRVDYIERETRLRKKERAVRERFHRDSFATPSDHARCDFCSLGSTDLGDPESSWYECPERKAIRHAAGALRIGLLGDGPLEAFGERLRLYPFEQQLREISRVCPSAVRCDGFLAVVVQRPDHAPTVEQIAAMTGEEREALFTARLGGPSDTREPASGALAQAQAA